MKGTDDRRRAGYGRCRPGASRFLVPVERREDLESVLHRVGLIFAGTGVKVVLLAVGHQAAGLREALTLAAAELAALGFDVTVDIASGAVPEAIARSARRHRADLVLLHNGPLRPSGLTAPGDD